MLLGLIDAAKRMKCSERTLWNKMKAGKLPYVVVVDESKPINFPGRNKRFIEFPDPPAPKVPETSKSDVSMPEPSTNLVERPLDPIEEQRQADLKFAKAYIAGEATDSSGNDYSNLNQKWPSLGTVSLLGPMEPKTKTKFSCDDHMKLQSRPHMIGTDGELVLSACDDNHPLNRGRANLGVKPKLQHPNQSRQDMLNQIWADIRRGFSR